MLPLMKTHGVEIFDPAPEKVTRNAFVPPIDANCAFLARMHNAQFFR